MPLDITLIISTSKLQSELLPVFENGAKKLSCQIYNMRILKVTCLILVFPAILRNKVFVNVTMFQIRKRKFSFLHITHTMPDLFRGTVLSVADFAKEVNFEFMCIFTT